MGRFAGNALFRAASKNPIPTEKMAISSINPTVGGSIIAASAVFRHAFLAVFGISIAIRPAEKIINIVFGIEKIVNSRILKRI